MDEAKENPLIMLPRSLVEALFTSANREVERAKRRIIRLEEKIKDIQGLIAPIKIRGSRHGRILVADGSRPKGASERIGSDFSIYAAGFMVFDGKETIAEDYEGGSISGIEDLSCLSILNRVLMAYAERKLALEAFLKHNPDVVLLDGPFFFFRGKCKLIHDITFEEGYFKKALDIVNETKDITLELMKTGRAMCIIKRSIIRAIDGWLLLNKGEASCVGIRDKYILSKLMPPNTFWSYDALLDYDPVIYSIAYRLAQIQKQKALKRDPKELIEKAIKYRDREYEENLKIEFKELPKTKRYYVRYSNSVSPFEIEVVKGSDVEAFIEYFTDFYNPATGLPYPIDLIDQNVRLPEGTTTAFTEEVESMLIKDKLFLNKVAVSDYFKYLNPQKKELV
ncbi:MAG: DNA double-strand break repair nuclease NurA [Candidatus Bathyarchaeia archaeon]